ncbi:hypothetical protein [Rhodanobacter aciditrophus]|uniref:hypothetical protein n=1 Tax=Rhodanobacter aciditrophus TaxID=1623218 RepID=UPI003CEE9B34
MSNTYDDSIRITARAREALVELGRYFGGSEERAFEVAINRLHVQLIPREEGELTDVDFCQSLPDKPEGLVESVHRLPGCN